MNHKGFTLLNYNFKGGVGKTTLTALFGYLLNERQKKTLLVDFDPQANLTDMIGKTYNKKFHPTMTLNDSLRTGDISESICHVTDYLDIVPTDWSLTQWSMRADNIKAPNRFKILDYMLSKVKHNYDYILLDVPPTFAPYSLNAMFAADGIAIVLETQQAPYTSALKTVSTIGTLKQKYDIKAHFLGVILYLKINAKVDREVEIESRKTFSNFLFSHEIHRQERVKGFSKYGVHYKDNWDRRAVGMYNQLLNETLKKIRRVE